MTPEQTEGGRVALALLRAAIIEDKATLDSVAVLASDCTGPVIAALVSLLAHTLVEGAGEQQALEGVDRWLLSLLDVEGKS